MRKKEKKTDTLAVSDNYIFCDRHTNTHTDRHGDSMTDPAQKAESVKIQVTQCHRVEQFRTKVKGI